MPYGAWIQHCESRAHYGTSRVLHGAVVHRLIDLDAGSPLPGGTCTTPTCCGAPRRRPASQGRCRDELDEPPHRAPAATPELVLVWTFMPSPRQCWARSGSRSTLAPPLTTCTTSPPTPSTYSAGTWPGHRPRRGCWPSCSCSAPARPRSCSASVAGSRGWTAPPPIWAGAGRCGCCAQDTLDQAYQQLDQIRATKAMSS